MAGDSTDDGADYFDNVWREADYDPANDEPLPPIRRSVEEVDATIRRLKELQDEIVSGIRAYGIAFPAMPDYRDILLADYSACGALPSEIAPLFFRLGMVMSDLFYLDDHRLRLIGIGQSSVSGNQKKTEQATVRRNRILARLTKLLADDPDARKLTISELADRLAPFFAHEKRGFSAANILRMLKVFEKGVIECAAEPRFAVLEPVERIRAIAAATRGKPGYSIETIEVVLRR